MFVAVTSAFGGQPRSRRGGRGMGGSLAFARLAAGYNSMGVRLGIGSKNDGLTVSLRHLSISVISDIAVGGCLGDSSIGGAHGGPCQIGPMAPCVHVWVDWLWARTGGSQAWLLCCSLDVDGDAVDMLPQHSVFCRPSMWQRALWAAGEEARSPRQPAPVPNS
ncbi:unnamed protein product [Ostreobium quekettii]|uniref:Uncharacterized protein n=1 Tax=Ostreobium quekettii TaxID=121088 RepID=A0A8S1IWS4_9CHLO|nr:unnamed protein product [Ostreobium quekettii]